MLKHITLWCWLLLTAFSPVRADDLPAANSGAKTLGGISLGTESKFLPVAQAYPLKIRLQGESLLVSWSITPDYYLYRERIQFNLQRDGVTRPIAIELPAGQAHEDPFLGATEVYRGLLDITLPLGDSAPFVLEVKSQGCADAGLCYPPRTQVFAVDPASRTVVETVATTPPTTPRLPPISVAVTTGGADIARLPYMLLLAALGGMILNLMPCVFPVLSLKVLSISASGTDHKAVHGLVYTAGVVLSFVAVAGLLLALRAAGSVIGWGFHLQSPPFVAALVYLFFAMGLGLSGAVNLGAGFMGIGGSLATRSGYAGSFFTGVLATVVASPCSAPFMGTALGYALTQSSSTALLVFAALGLGMASPFLLFALSPGLRRHLPAPGAWMDGFKQLLAFPLYAAAVWLLWVLGKQSGVNGMAAVSGGCVSLALALWLWERALRHRHPAVTRVVAAAVFAVAVLLLRSPLLDVQSRERSQAGERWETYSPERLAQLRNAGTPVFINVTADWCLTCLANEKIALSNQRVQEAFERGGIVYLKGDWTNSDPQLTQLLQAHGRSGVPLYLLYAKGSSPQPRILPQLLTPGIVLEAL